MDDGSESKKGIDLQLSKVTFNFMVMQNKTEKKVHAFLFFSQSVASFAPNKLSTTPNIRIDKHFVRIILKAMPNFVRENALVPISLYL